MKLSSAVLSSTLVAACSAFPVRLVERVAFDASLVPLLGFTSGINPTGASALISLLPVPGAGTFD